MSLVWVGLEKLIRLLLGILVFSLAVRIFGSKFIANFNVLQTYILIIQTVIWYGIEAYVSKQVTLARLGKKHILIFIIIRLVLLSCTLLLIFIFSNTSSQITMLSIMLISLFFYSLQAFEPYFSAKMKIAVVCKINILSLCLGTGIKFYGIYINEPLLFVLGFVFEALIYSLLIAFNLKKIKSDELMSGDYLSDIYDVFSKSTPIFFSALIFVLINKINLLYLEYFGLAIDLENYVLATKVSELLLIIPTVVSAYLYPVMSKRDDVLQSSPAYYQLVMYFLVPIVSLMLCAKEYVFLALFGELKLTIDGYYLYFISLSWPIIVCFRVISGRIMILKGWQKLLLPRAIVSLFIMLALHVFLYPRLGLIGIGISTTVGFVYLSFISDLQNRKTRSIFMYKVLAMSTFFNYSSIRRCKKLLLEY